MAIESTEGLGPADFDLIARFIHDEKERRAQSPKRRTLATIWKEIDRQLAMDPVSREIISGQREDWYPNQELPMQYTALEVIAADARRLKFPRGSEWYSVLANLSDEYLNRWQKRRESMPMIGSMAAPMANDQDTANVLIKAVMDHYHRLYDFRSAIDLFDAEMIKYGTGVARVRNVRIPKLLNTFRGYDAIQGPCVIPLSIKTTFLDDTPSAVMLEGYKTGPLNIRQYYQRLIDLQKAANAGKGERGWRSSEVADLKPLNQDEHKGQVEMLEAEGDVIVSRSDGSSSVYLPNVQVWVAVGNNGPCVVRLLENQTPFHSYVVGHYMRDDVESPYGSSPLMRGQPLQEGATSVFNDLTAAARLNGKPPVVWDANDPRMNGVGGPVLFPGASVAVDNIESGVKALEIGDLQGLANAYLALVKQYEDVTGVNDPRRGAQVNSHTTATAIDIEATRGQSRTDDFVQGVEQGPLTTILNMEFALAKQSLRTPQDIAIGMDGIEGWVKIGAADLADEATFTVHGSAGILSEKERAQNFVQAATFLMQVLAPAAQQMGMPLGIKADEIARRIFELHGVNDAGKFVGASQSVPPGIAVSAGVQGAAAQLPPGALAGMAAQHGNGSGEGGPAGTPPAV